MAGIGFALRDFSRKETLSSVAGAALHAAVIAAGPWLFTVISLVAITAVAEPFAGYPTLATFRAALIYAFAISLVLSAPVAMVATRLVADALWQHRLEAIQPLLTLATLTAVSSASLGVLGIWVYFDLPTGLAATLFATTSIVSMIWVALAFCGAIKDYAGITVSFAVGLTTATIAAVIAGLYGFGASVMVWGFALGLAITYGGLLGRVLASFPQAPWTLRREVETLMRGFSRYGYLALGAFFSTAGLWVDKWVFWFSPERQTVSGGLIHAPLYDSAMFIASLVIVPALSQFIVVLETGFFDRYQRYYGVIQSHGTIDQIEAARFNLAEFSAHRLTLTTISQIAIATIVVLLAPAIVDVLNLQFRQIAILRYGALGSVFQFIFIASTALIVFFDRRRWYLALQVLFFALNLSLSALTVRLGEDYYGLGYFAATVVASAVAFIVAESTLSRLNYLTFVGNNPAVIFAPRRARRPAKS